MVDNVFVISHPRSGTHLMIDTIINNFENVNKDWVDIDRLTSRFMRRIDIDHIQQKVEHGLSVVKTHTVTDLDNYFENKPEYIDYVEHLLDESKRIYMLRDGRDVMTSFYFFMQHMDKSYCEISFSDFLREEIAYDILKYPNHDPLNPVEFWVKHVEGWLSEKNLFILKFEELRDNFYSVLPKITNYIGAPRTEEVVCPVRKDKITYKSPFLRTVVGTFKVLYRRIVAKKYDTSIFFRKGKVGDYKNHFSKDDLAFFNSIAKKTMKKIGYY